MKRDYLSTSALKAFAKSPNHYLQYVSEQRLEPTPAMVFGSAVHCHILEPNEFDARYFVAPQIDRRTKAGREKYAALQKEHEGKEILNAKDWERLQLVDHAIRSNSQAMDILNGATATEQDKTAPIEGIPFRGIADIVGANWVADLKTTTNASPDGFGRSATNLGYHLQGAAYCALWQVPHFYWIAVETDAPWNVQVYRQHPDALAKSDRRLRELIHRWNAWDGTPGSYSPDIEVLDLPKWA